MGTLYSVFPMGPEVGVWLTSIGVTFDPAITSRLPTGREIQEVVCRLPGFRATINDGGIGRYWQATIEEDTDHESATWTLLNISNYRGPDEPAELWFEKGSTALVLRVVREITKATGTLLVHADCGGNPVVVTPVRSIEEMMDAW